jgi:hypothetical protein
MAVSGTITVTTAGTRVQAAHKGNVRSLVFKARQANTGDICIGGTDVSASEGFVLAPGESVQMTFRFAISTAQIWADAYTNGDKIDFIGLE